MVALRSAADTTDDEDAQTDTIPAIDLDEILNPDFLASLEGSLVG